VFESTNVAFQMGKDDTKSEQSLKMAELETRIVGFKAIAKAGRLFLKEGAVMCTTKPNSFVRAQVLAIARALSLSPRVPPLAHRGRAILRTSHRI